MKPVRPVCRHGGKDGFFREINHGAVGHGGRASHAEITLAEKNEGFFHDIDAACHIGDACFNHVGFIEIAEIDALIGHRHAFLTRLLSEYVDQEMSFTACFHSHHLLPFG